MTLDEKLPNDGKIDFISAGIALIFGLGITYTFYTEVYQKDNDLHNYSIVEDIKKAEKVPLHTIWQP